MPDNGEVSYSEVQIPARYVNQITLFLARQLEASAPGWYLVTPAELTRLKTHNLGRGSTYWAMIQAVNLDVSFAEYLDLQREQERLVRVHKIEELLSELAGLETPQLIARLSDEDVAREVCSGLHPESKWQSAASIRAALAGVILVIPTLAREIPDVWCAAELTIGQ